ncbi:MAG: hypothetical protein N2C14_27495 [Planctomycetales bacterium]
MNVLGVDVGGANLKAADGQGKAVSLPFELWRQPRDLPHALTDLAKSFPTPDRVAITMTAELADCFRTKEEGVACVLDACREAFAGNAMLVYLTDGRFVSPEEAQRDPWSAAASNWRALAAFAGRCVPGGVGMLIDLGSTTCDLIPLIDGVPFPLGLTDPDRLASGSLVYAGAGRTPVCSLVSSLPWRDRSRGIARELFATAQDVYVTLGDLPENFDDCSTADGRPATREFARDRLARCVCADRSVFSDADAMIAARAVESAQLQLMRAAWEQTTSQLASPPSGVVTSGVGEFLVKRLLESMRAPVNVISLAEESAMVSGCAPAHAVAVLAREQENPS